MSETTGNATAIVTLTAGTSASVIGLDFLSGILYASGIFPGTGTARFGSIDLVTGSFNEINNQGGSGFWAGLAANEGADVLYTVDGGDLRLKSITAAGAISTIGVTGRDVVGLAYDNANAILYGVDDNADIYTISTSTGAATLVGSTGLPNRSSYGLALDPFSGILYLNSDANLYRIDKLTGLETLVGPNLFNRIEGLAFQSPSPVPEPGSLALLATGLTGLVVRTRYRKKR